MTCRKDLGVTFKSTKMFHQVEIARYPYVAHVKVSRWLKTCSAKLLRLVQIIPTQEVVVAVNVSDLNKYS